MKTHEDAEMLHEGPFTLSRWSVRRIVVVANRV